MRATWAYRTPDAPARTGAGLGEQSGPRHLLAHARSGAGFRIVDADRDLAPQRQMCRTDPSADARCLVKIGVKNAFHPFGRMEPRADLRPAARGLAGGVLAYDGDPYRRMRALQRARHEAQIGEAPIFAVMRDHRRRQRRIHDLDRLVAALACLGDAQPDLRHFLRDAGGGADLQSSLGKVVQRADLFTTFHGW